MSGSIILAIVGWALVAITLLVQRRMSAELDRLRRYRAAAEGQGYYTKAEVDEAWERLKNVNFADAIATEARRAETTKIGSVHEGAGPQDIAQRTHP